MKDRGDRDKQPHLKMPPGWRNNSATQAAQTTESSFRSPVYLKWILCAKCMTAARPGTCDSVVIVVPHVWKWSSAPEEAGIFFLPFALPLLQGEKGVTALCPQIRRQLGRKLQAFKQNGKGVQCVKVAGTGTNFLRSVYSR